MKPRSKRYLIGGGGLIVVTIGVLLALPLVLNPAYFKEMAFSYIQQTFGPHINVGKISLSFFPSPHVEISEVIVKKSPDTHAFFRAKFISLDLKIGSLLLQEFAVKELFIDQPEIELKKNRDGDGWVLPSSTENDERAFWASLLYMEKIVLSNGSMTLIDESPKEEARGVVFESVNFSLFAEESTQISASVDASGKIRRGQRASEFSWKGLVEFRASEMVPVGGDSPELLPAVHVDGDVKVADLDLEQFAELFHLDVPPQADLGLANIECQVKILPGQVGYEVILNKLRLDSEMGSFSGNANVTGIMSSDRTIFVSLSSTPISLSIIHRVFPKHQLPSPIASKWDEMEIDGTVQIVQATLAGSTRSDVGMSLVGTFQLDQSSLRSSQRLPLIENIHGTIEIEPDRVRFSDFTGIYDDIPVRSGDGLILFKESGPWLEANVEGKVPAQHVLKFLANPSGTKKAQSRFSQIKEMEGGGELRLQFAGMLEGGEGISLTAGEYNVEDLSFRVSKIQDSIFIPQGRVQFTSSEVKFDEVNGFIGESQFRINGVVNFQKSVRFDRVNIQAVLTDTLLAQFLSKSVNLSHLAFTGNATLQAVVSGLINSPTIKGELDLLDSTFQLSSLVKKQQGVPGSLNFDIRSKSNGDVALDQVELAILPFRISARGLLRLNPTFEILARVNTGPIYLGLLPEGVTVGQQIVRAGILEISMDVKGRGLDMQTWRPKGWVALTEGVVNVKDLSAPVTNLFLRLKLSPTVAEFKRLEFKVADSDVHLTGTVRNWKNNPEIDVILESSRFDLGMLVPQEGRSSIRDVLENLAAKSTLVGNIHINHSTYQKLSAKNLTGVLKIRDGLVTLDRIRGEAYGEPLAGRVFIHLPQNKAPAIRSSFHLKGLPFEQIHQSIGHEERLITGRFSVRGMVQGHGRDPRGMIPTLNGNMDVMLEQGHFQKAIAMSRILALLNLPTVLADKVDLNRQGLPFNKITATLTIKEGVLNTKNFLLDSPLMKMTTAGRYNMANDNLDLVAAVSPFGRYSDTLKKIPLFGRILQGERKGIATALFKVQGSLTDPDVRYLPLKSFSTGLTGLSQLAFDILKNTIRLPVDLLSSEKRDQEKDSLSPVSAGETSAPIP